MCSNRNSIFDDSPDEDEKHRAVWRFAPLSATFTASPSSWLRCLEAVRGGAKQSYFLTPRCTSSMRLPRRRAHTRAWRTHSPLAPRPSPAPLASHSLPWAPALVGRERSVDNCLLLTCLQTTLSHFAASLILRYTCHKCHLIFTPPLPAILWRVLFPSTPPVHRQSGSIHISLTVRRSGTPKNATLSFMDVSWHVLW